MALTEKQVTLIYQIYQVVQIDSVVLTQGEATTVPSFTYPGTNIQQQVIKAINFINASDARVDRVAEILNSYEDFDLDPSNINKNGYEFRASRSLKAIRNALFPLTGIIWKYGSGNQINYG